MEGASAIKTRLTVLERNRLVDALLLAGMPVGLLLFGAFLIFNVGFGALGIHLAAISAVVRFSAVRQNSRAKPVDRDIEVSAEGVKVDGELIPRARIAEGWYQPRIYGQSTIRLFDRHRRIVFEARVATEAQALAMLRTLGLDASQKRAEFRTVSPLAERQQSAAFVTLASIFIVVFTRFFMTTGPAPFFASMVLMGALMLLPAKVVVGVDGVLVKWLWRKRFIPMADIVTVQEDGSTAIRIELTGGRVEMIRTESPKRRGGVFTERRDLILARIRESWQTHRSRGPGADISTLVARGTRSLDEWKKALSALETGDAGYRQAALREEDLWRVVEDPRASEDARAAAALLLRKGLDPSGKQRVRVAAEATASPKLRIALEAATSEDDEAALEALDELETKPLRAAGAVDR